MSEKDLIAEDIAVERAYYEREQEEELDGVPHTIYPFPGGIEPGDWSERHGSAEELAERVETVAQEIRRKLGWYENAAILHDAAEALRDLGERKEKAS